MYNDENQYENEIWVKVFIFENTFIKYWSFDSLWWHHQPNNWSKSSKLVFHVPIFIERYKSKVKGTLTWNIRLWNCFLKILKFWLNVVTSSNQNWLEKGSKHLSLVLIVIERCKSKVKETLRWGIRLWNYFLEIFKF